MAKQLEITAMKTSGISFLRVAMYPIIFSVLVSTTVLWIIMIHWVNPILRKII